MAKTNSVTKTNLAVHSDDRVFILVATQYRKRASISADQRRERRNKVAWKSAGMSFLVIVITHDRSLEVGDFPVVGRASSALSERSHVGGLPGYVSV
jgi:hypothetical protein